MNKSASMIVFRSGGFTVQFTGATKDMHSLFRERRIIKKLDTLLPGNGHGQIGNGPITFSCEARVSTDQQLARCKEFIESFCEDHDIKLEVRDAPVMLDGILDKAL